MSLSLKASLPLIPVMSWAEELPADSATLAAVMMGLDEPMGDGLSDLELSAVAASRDDATVEELIEVYRLVGGKEHPDWDEYRQAMVDDRRLVARLHVTHLYGKVA